MYLKYILKSQNNQKNPKRAPVPFNPSKVFIIFNCIRRSMNTQNYSSQMK